MDNKLIILKFAELMLKSKRTRSQFENQLLRNIDNALKQNNLEFSLEKKHSRIYIKTKNTKKAIKVLKNIFGLVLITPAVICKSDLNDIKKTALKIAKQNKLNSKKTFAIKSKRVTKTLKQTSLELDREIGAFIQKNTKAPVKLKNPSLKIGIEIIDDQAHLFSETIRAHEGLPVGVSGKVICLISSKKEDLVAAWLMLRRGANIIPLHIKTSETSEKEFLKNIKLLEKFSPSSKLKPLVIKSKDLLLAAEQAAKKYNAKAIILGTTNIKNTLKVSKIPIFYPLISLDKKTISEFLKEI